MDTILSDATKQYVAAVGRAMSQPTEFQGRQQLEPTIDQARKTVCESLERYIHSSTQTGRNLSLLVAVDDGELSHLAIEVAGRLSAKLPARIYLLNVVEPQQRLKLPLSMSWADATCRLWQDAEDILSIAALRLPEHVQVDKLVHTGRAAEEILACAAEKDVDLILMGLNGPGRLAHFFIGGVTDEVLRAAPCPVLVIDRETASQLFRSPALCWPDSPTDYSNPNISAGAI